MKHLLSQINDIVEKCKISGKRAVLAIDGMSASGKTTLAEELAEQFSGSVIHTDDFHLPFELRTEERRAQPGGNLDYERFAREVLPYLNQKIEITYGRFSCREGKIVETVNIGADCPLVIVEGAYSMRPEFRKAYDLSICMLISEELPELIGMSDRILVMFEGSIVAELDPQEVTVQELGLYMAGSKRQDMAGKAGEA